MSLARNLARIIEEHSRSGIIWFVHRESGRLIEFTEEMADRLDPEERAQFIERLTLVDALETSERIALAKRARN